MSPINITEFRFQYYFALFLYLFVSFLSQGMTHDSSFNTFNFPLVRNNILRAYVLDYPKHIRKQPLKSLEFFINKTTNKIAFYLTDANCKYYSLSEEDRAIIESVIALTY